MIPSVGIRTWLNTPAPIPSGAQDRVERFSSSLQSMIISTAAQQAMNPWGANALSVAAIYRARMMNADTLGSLPVMAGKSLIGAPNATQDTQEFIVETVLSMEDVGEAYWEVQQGNLRVLHPSKMQVSWDTRETTRLYEYDGRRMRTEGMARNLIVLAMNRGPQALRGVGPLQSPRIRGLIAEQKYSQEFFEGQAQPTGLLTHPGMLSADEAQKLHDQWELGQKTRSTGVLSGGADYKAMSFSPQDSEFVMTHLVGVGDVATLFGVPSALLNYNQPGSSITYQAIGDVYEGYWRQTLAPTYARRIERAWTGVAGVQVKFDPEELFLASLRERGEVAVALVGAGYDAADALDVTGLPPMKYEKVEDAPDIPSPVAAGTVGSDADS